MIVRTPWLDSALGDGPEAREADERFNTKTVSRPSRPYYEVQITGELADVLNHVANQWESGDDESDMEQIKYVVAGLTIVNPEAEAREAAREAALSRLIEAREAYEAAELEIHLAQKALDALPH